MAKKVVAKKKTKLTKKLAKEMTPMKTPKVGLISFRVSAVIPTQQYGNIQPSIEVMAGSIEDARAVVMPIIEDLYQTYAELPLNGKEPKFYGKITAETVNVAAPAPKEKEVAESSPSSTAASEVATSPTTVPSKSDAVLKAEKAIGLAMSIEATEAIQSQIEKSVKIEASDKPALYTLVLKKRKELKK